MATVRLRGFQVNGNSGTSHVFWVESHQDQLGKATHDVLKWIQAEAFHQHFWVDDIPPQT